MSNLLHSYEFAELLEKSEADYMTGRMIAMQERPGNPMGIEMAEFGGATAFYSKAMPWPQFNTVKGIGPEELPIIDEILEFYASRGGKCQFEIIPTKANKELMQALHERSYYQSDFHAALYRETGELNTCRHAVTVRVLTEDEVDVYAEIHCLGTGLPVSGKHHVAANNKVLFNRKGWKFYVGFVHDVPAGVGVMYMNQGQASLTFATTLHEFRQHGVQQALIERRIKDAGMNHCGLVIGQAAYASTSYRNMQRSGMKLGYTRATWIRA